jgi:excisionase family DNA binding protein
MPQELYSVEQVADLLNLHVRTVRNYVREGRLKAVRIGKQYRIARENLEAMTGRPASSFEREPVRRHRHVEVSSIIEIDAVSPDTASRVMNLVGGSYNSRRSHEEVLDEPLRIETIYDAERARLKVILVGGMDANASYFKMIHAVLES